ncbi:hypothetical protein STRTUCAR8_03886 [Streptomyces turgidiscabies Car8]|uniref:Uncharacterized protein n=1 Tax=Streptomyces turgidiscabies (strain Car8) TaxID=698760 RepID=L7FBZ6_STRT8|nr:hypothetical protein STRTUCAR8_03886 [Streptomyces turgidiscabies Car8]
MRRCDLGGSGVRLAHGPQSSIDRLCQRLEMKNPLAQEGTPRRCRPRFVSGRD